MAKYRVTLSLDIEVFAEDQRDAREKAVELAESGALDESFRRDSGPSAWERVENED